MNPSRPAPWSSSMVAMREGRWMRAAYGRRKKIILPPLSFFPHFDLVRRRHVSGADDDQTNGRGCRQFDFIRTVVVDSGNNDTEYRGILKCLDGFINIVRSRRRNTVMESCKERATMRSFAVIVYSTRTFLQPHQRPISRLGCECVDITPR